MPSYSPVYSSPLILGSGSTGYPSFAVPSGFTAVVRDFSMWDSVGGAVVQLILQDSEAAPGITVARVGGLGVAEYVQWQGRVVGLSGAILSLAVTSAGADPDVYVGGYLLRNTLT